MFAAPRHTWQRLLTAGGIGLLLATVTHAALVTNPTLVTGSDSIDPIVPSTNAGVVDANKSVTNAAAKGDLTDLVGFGVIQSFVGFTGAQTASVNYFDFTLGPDIRITTASNNGSGGGQSNDFTTSGTSSQYLGNSAPKLPSGDDGVRSQTIEFGTYSPSPASFISDQSVYALSFMMSVAASGNATWTAKFFDTSGTQVGPDQVGSPTTAGDAMLFGLISMANPIRSAVITMTGANQNTFMDDLGFTTVAIPEPSAFRFGGLICGVLAGQQLRKRLRGQH